MKIVAIDASPARGVISLSVEEAARAAETAGAEVFRVRLASLRIHSCSGCGMCSFTGVCKIADDLPRIAEAIDEADGVIFGLPGYFRRRDDITQTVPDDRQLTLPGVTALEAPPIQAARASKRAVIITACSTPEPLASFFGYTTGPIRELRGALDVGGSRTVGSLAITGAWGRHAFDEWERDKACSLGRMLAGKI